MGSGVYGSVCMRLHTCFSSEYCLCVTIRWW